MVRGSKHRRTFLALATGSVTAGLAGCLGGGGNGNGDSDGNGADENNSSDQDPEEQVPDADETVLVGPEGEFVFEPDSLEIDPERRSGSSGRATATISSPETYPATPSGKAN